VLGGRSKLAAARNHSDDELLVRFQVVDPAVALYKFAAELVLKFCNALNVRALGALDGTGYQELVRLQGAASCKIPGGNSSHSFSLG
jgi:hypothetical protein